ncbi:MAG: helix-turn-helix domain-containing protein [Proteobacteria bacterium]|nr:helix-turn-helix domain-containing protein [Pseudomonadota bacterium]
MRSLQIERAEAATAHHKSHSGIRLTFSTDGLPPSQQFDAYQAHCAPVLDIAPTEHDQAGFSANCDMWTLGGLVLRRIRVPAGSFARSTAQVRRDNLDHWVFNVTISGRQIAQTAEDRLATDAGVPSIFSLAGAYTVQRTDIDWLGLFIPRGAIPALDAGLRHDQHTLLDDAGARVLAAHLIALVSELPAMAEEDVPRVGRATQAMAAACVMPSAPPADDAAPRALPRMVRVQNLIERHLGVHTLGPALICRYAGVSRSNLYRMFEPHGGVVHYIRRRRLQRVHNLIADPNCNRTIASIADGYCFSDLAAFGRAFRREFGYSASELRRSGDRGSLLQGKRISTMRVSPMHAWDMLYRV